MSRGRDLQFAHALASHSDQSGRPAGVTKDGRRPGLSRAAIADDMSCSLSTVDRSIRRHKADGLTVVENRPGYPSVYHLRPREGSKAWEHVQMRRERAAGAKARHRGRVTAPPQPAATVERCDDCGVASHLGHAQGCGRAPPTP